VGLATITLALIAWPLGFNFGAYGQVFYEDVFSMVVAASATLATAVVLSPPERRLPRSAALALAAPAVWLALAVAFFQSVQEAASSPLFGTIGLALVFISVPVIIWTLIRLFNPDLTRTRGHRARLGSAVIIIVAALAGFVVGANNDAFMVCDDFKVAGSDLPANCAKPEGQTE
jgi:hypothetical protein